MKSSTPKYDTAYLKSLAKHHASRDKEKRELQALCANVLAASKRSIFATQRSDAKAAAKELADALKDLVVCKKFVAKEPLLTGEGMLRAAFEEYAEAYMYNEAMTGGRVGRVPELPADPEIYLGALSDLTGEMTRSCVLAATDRKKDEVKRLSASVREAVEFMLTLNMTGNLRQKFDQAKQNLRKIEEISFTLAMSER
jgi:predicted translin family RNA/ssDNA-binding protein